MNRFDIALENTMKIIFEMETTIGILWCFSVRDDFRHMWE